VRDENHPLVFVAGHETTALALDWTQRFTDACGGRVSFI
jgi:hypothetical protein